MSHQTVKGPRDAATAPPSRRSSEAVIVSDEVQFEQQDADPAADFQTVLSRRYDELRLKEEVERARQANRHHMQRESELRRLVTDPTVIVTSDVALALGRLREFANDQELRQMDGLIDEVEKAIDEQMLLLIANRSESGASPLNSGGSRSDAGSSPTASLLGNYLIGRKGGRNVAAGRSGVGGGVVDDSVRSPPGGALRRLTLSSDATTAAPAPAQSLTGPTSSFHAGGGESLPSSVALSDVVGGAVYLCMEALQHTIGCQSVRLYLMTTTGSVETGNSVRAAKLVACSPPLDVLKNESGGPVRVPALPRSIESATFGRGIAISGHEAAAIVARGGAATAAAAEASSSSSAPLKTYLSWPVTVWEDGQRTIVGVIECINKLHSSGGSGGENTATPFGNASASSSTPGTSAAVNGGGINTPDAQPLSAQGPGAEGTAVVGGAPPPELRRFTPRDEAHVHAAALQLSVMLERYPRSFFFQSKGKEVHRVAASHTDYDPEATSHVVNALCAPTGMLAVRSVAQHALHHVAPVSIYRGPTTMINRFTAPPGGGGAGGGGKNPAAANSSADALAAATAATTSVAIGYSGDIRSMEENLDALNLMWHAAYNDNVAMHQRCRTMGEEIRELKALVAQFHDVLVTARGMAKLDEVQAFLRSAELSLRSGKASILRKATSQHSAAAGVSSSSAGQAPLIRIADLHVEGPSSVRQYTVDGPSKLAQVAAIEDALKAEERALQDARDAEERSRPRFTRPTLSASKRSVPTAASNTGAAAPTIGTTTVFRLRPPSSKTK